VSRWSFEKRAERENARRTAEAPLLAAAGLVPLTTPEEQRQRKERIHAEAEQQHAKMAETIAAGIARYTELLGDHAQVVLNRYKSIPRNEMLLDVLSRAWRRVEAGQEALAPEQRLPTAAEVAAAQVRVTALKALWQRIDEENPVEAAAAVRGESKAVARIAELRRAAEARTTPPPCSSAPPP